MNNMRVLARRYVIYTMLIIILMLVGSLFIAEPKFFIGLAFGTSISLLNLLSTYFQVKRIGKSMQDRKYRFSIGTIGRIIVVLIALVIAQQFPQYLDLTGVIIGLAVTYLILLIEPVLHNLVFALKE